MHLIAGAGSPQADYEVLAQYERDDRWFTQGLASPEGHCLCRRASMEIVVGVLNLETGQLKLRIGLTRQVFGGLTQTPDAVWQITYKEGLAYKRDPKTLAILETLHYEEKAGAWLRRQPRQSLMTNWALLSYRNEILKPLSSSGDWGRTRGNPLNGSMNPGIRRWQALWQYLVSIVKLDPETGVIEGQYDFTALIKEYKLEAQLTPVVNLMCSMASPILARSFLCDGKYYPMSLKYA